MMMKRENSEIKRHQTKAVVTALFVTILWASSWVIIKFGLEEISPLMFAGMRYGIASLILASLSLSKKTTRAHFRNRSMTWWGRLLAYGLIFITATQGAQFLALSYLPAITLSLLLNLTPIVVLMVSIPVLAEKPSPKEVGFIFLGLVGVLLYFYPTDILSLSAIGLVIGMGALASNSLSTVFGRAINRSGDTPYLIVTTISMSFGSVFLLLAGFITEGFVALSWASWIYVLWLAVINTALAFTLWNKAMTKLRAIDMTLINSTMMPQIVLLSLLFLGEYPSALDWTGLSLLAVGVASVQILQLRRSEERPADVLGKG
jgi:drug/metabolite transporter (DMT)-like permease